MTATLDIDWPTVMAHLPTTHPPRRAAAVGVHPRSDAPRGRRVVAEPYAASRATPVPISAPATFLANSSLGQGY